MSNLIREVQNRLEASFFGDIRAFIHDQETSSLINSQVEGERWLWGCDRTGRPMKQCVRDERVLSRTIRKTRT
ncbi:hypothetical protein NPIL_455251 [Nephila pilipes]|uniref:Uncharacterized protein n=1 Tax=Nephila pilipes TaxID=299642 RepID=A0A8X6QGN7_NEPPI|nr:hypothetical protein NPIL_455251 [Nephila pilipes]